MSRGGYVICAVALLVVATPEPPVRAEEQENARVTSNTYIYLYPDSTRKPFARLQADSLVTILGVEGDWYNITIVDAKGERRYGYVRQRAIERLPPTLSASRSAPAIDSSPTREAKPISPASEPPSREAAPTASTNAPARASDLIRLQDIRKVFIEPMASDLDQYIRAEITKQLNGRLVVVLHRDGADAILRGAAENRTGVGAAITGRYLGLHDNASASVSLVDRAETVVLWASEAGDRSLMFGVMARGGQRKVADRLVKNLKKVLAAP